MRIFYPLLLALLLVGVSCDISFFQSSFKYPYSSNNVLLDIDIQTQDATLVDIQIQIPSSSTRESNSIFSGPAFGPRTISGFSTHKRVTTPAVASISWNGVDTLTFHALDNTPIGTSSQGNGWVNFNFYMMDSQFNSPTAPNFQDDLTKLPLDLTYDNDYTGNKPKFIDLAFDNHFNVITVNTRV